MEGYAGQVSELCLGFQPPADADGIAGHTSHAAAGVAKAEAGDILATVLNAERYRAVHGRDASRHHGCHVVEALGEGDAVAEQSWNGRRLRGERRGVDHSCHISPGYGVLVSDQPEQGASPQEGDTATDGAALSLESDLRRAERGHAGSGPPRYRNDAVHCSGA